jgi:UDPglucose 6-dehydrogenase
VKRKSPPAPTVGIVGAGYMGMATALGFAHGGRRVFAYDLNQKVRASLRAGKSPYHEAGLEELLRTEIRRARFIVVDTLAELVESARCIFICVPTPATKSGRINLAPLRSAVRELGDLLRAIPGYHLVVVKSTVVPGTTESVVEPLLRKTSGKGPESLGVACNPEFLAEGRMVRDTLFPERIVVGTTDLRSRRTLASVYRHFQAPMFELSPSEAELVKYASNTFLALKVSFANELSRWTELFGGDIDDVAGAIGADPRVGASFLRAGPGFGGSCFDKDLRAFLGRAKELGIAARSAEAALAINREQTEHASELIRSAAGKLRGKRVAVLGLAFKAGTDDVRESRAFPIVEQLLRSGAQVRVHDPAAMNNFRREWHRQFGRSLPGLTFSPSVPTALRGVDLAVLQAEWPVYLSWSPRWTQTMRKPLLVDLRRAIPHPIQTRAGLTVVSLGAGAPRAGTDHQRPKGPPPRRE